MSFRSCIKSPRGLGQFMPVTPRADMLDSRFTSPVLVVPRSDSSELWGICRAEVMFTPPVAVRPTRSPGCSLMTMAFFNRRRAIAVACRSVPLLPVMREQRGVVPLADVDLHPGGQEGGRNLIERVDHRAEDAA